MDEAERVEDILMFGGGLPPRPPVPRPAASAPLPATRRAAPRSSARMFMLAGITCLGVCVV